MELRLVPTPVLGAGAVVTKNMPEDSVCLGVPARAVRKQR